MYYVTFTRDNKRYAVRLAATDRTWAIRFAKERYGSRITNVSAVRIG